MFKEDIAKTLSKFRVKQVDVFFIAYEIGDPPLAVDFGAASRWNKKGWLEFSWKTLENLIRKTPMRTTGCPFWSNYFFPLFHRKVYLCTSTRKQQWIFELILFRPSLPLCWQRQLITTEGCYLSVLKKAGVVIEQFSFIDYCSFFSLRSRTLTAVFWVCKILDKCRFCSFRNAKKR